MKNGRRLDEIEKYIDNRQRDKHHQRIAVHCLDLFLINSYQVYLFFTGIIANYILLIGFIDQLK